MKNIFYEQSNFCKINLKNSGYKFHDINYIKDDNKKNREEIEIGKSFGTRLSSTKCLIII